MTAYKRQDGRWEAYSGSGKTRLRAYGKTREDALANLSAKVKVPGGDMRLGACLARWLDDHRASLAETSVCAYESACRAFQDLPIGSAPVQSLTKATVSEIFSRWVSERAAHGTLKLRLHVLRAMYKDLGLPNPTEGFKLVGAPAPAETRVLTKEECKRLAQATGWVRHYIAIALGTGARIGEIIGLTRGDFDLEARTVTIRYQRREGKVRRKLKTAGSRRTLTLPPSALESATVMCAGLGEDDLLFEAGARATLNALHSAADATGVDRFGSHTLRHTVASHLAASGIPAHHLKTLLGHSSIQITMDLYAHAMPEARDETAKRLATVLGA